MKNVQKITQKITKLRRSIKAISPIISVLLLIAIAVVASLVVYAWVMGYIGGSTTKAGMGINIQSFSNDQNGNLTIYVQNTGLGAVQLNPASAVYINGTLVPILSPLPANDGLITIAQGQTVALVVAWPYSGPVTIKVVTTSGTFMTTTGTASPGYQVTFGTSGGGGDSTTSPSGTNTYPAGQQVGISATAAAGYTFSSWSTTGPITIADKSSASTTATVNGAGTITATFTQTNYNVVFGTSGSGTTSPTGTGSYTAGQQVTISATAGANYKFSDWSATGSITFADASSASTTATVNGAGTVTATFVSVHTLTTITISPATSSIAAAGGSQTYTATGYDQNGVSMGDVTSSTTFSITSGAGGTWSSATYTPANAGTWTVTGTDSGVTGTAQLTVFGTLAGFSFSPIGSQIAGTSFSVTITAVDASGNTVTNYAGSATLTDLSGSISPVTTGAFTAGVWTGPVTITKALPTTYLDAITATGSTSSITGQSSSFTVSPGAATKLVVSGFPSSVVAGTAGSVTVTAEDASGNVATGYTGTVEITSIDAQAVLPSNYQFTAIDAGVHVFSVTLKTAGSQSITATDTVTSSITGSQTGITVTAGALASFAFGAISSPQTAGTSFSVTITALDSYENTVTSYSGTPTLSDTSGTISPTITSGFVGGVWTSSVTITKAYTADAITANDSSLVITGQSNPFTVNPGALASFAFGAISNPQTAGTAFSITITAYDQFGNVETNYAGPAALSDVTGSLTPTSTAAFTAGVYTGPVTITKTNPADVITVTDTSGIYVKSNAFTVSPGPLASFTFGPANYPIGSSQTAGTAFTITITAYDSLGNVETNYAGPAVLSDSSGTLSPTSAAFTAGVYTGPVTITKTYTADVITVTDSSTGITAPSNSFNVFAGTLNTFVFSPINQQIAGTAFTVTVTAEDSEGNTILNYAGSLTFTDSSGTITLQGTGVFTNGVANGLVTITKAYPADIITATDSITGLSGKSGSFNVVAAPATKLVYTAGTSQSLTTGQVSSVITVQLEDQYGNTVTATATGGDTVTLTATGTTTGTFWSNSAGTTKITSINIPVGSSSASFYYSDTTAGTPTLTASYTGLTSAPTAFTISSYKLVFVPSTSQSLAPGQYSSALQVERENPDGSGYFLALGITVGLQSTTGSFYSSIGGSVITSITIGTLASNSASFYFMDSSPGPTTLTATSGGYTPGTATFTIYTATLGSFSFSTIANNQKSGTAFSITITALDQNGNPFTTYTGTNTLTVSGTGSTISPTSTTAFVAGVWTGSVTLTTTSTSISISTSGGGATGTSNTFTVYTPQLNHFTVTASSYTQTAGTAFTITITAIDQNGNTYTGYTATNTLTDSTGTISPITTGAFTAGVCQVSVKLTKSGTGITISTSGGGDTGTSNAFTINPGALASFTMTGYPTSEMAGTSFGSSNNVVVTAYDAYGNVATNFRGSVSFTSTDAQATLPSTYTFTAADNGLHTFAGTGFTLKTAGSQTIKVTSGTVTITSGAITVSPGALYQYVFGSIGTQETGKAFTVTITQEDRYGNIVTANGGTPTLEVSHGSVSSSGWVFSNGVWTGQATVTETSTRTVYLYVNNYETEQNSGTFTVNYP